MQRSRLSANDGPGLHGTAVNREYMAPVRGERHVDDALTMAAEFIEELGVASPPAYSRVRPDPLMQPGSAVWICHYRRYILSRIGQMAERHTSVGQLYRSIERKLAELGLAAVGFNAHQDACAGSYYVREKQFL